MTIESLVDYLTPDFMLQRPAEAVWLYHQVRRLSPRRILEIGRWMGGTAALFAATGADVVSIDPTPQSARAWELSVVQKWYDDHLGYRPNISTIDGSSRHPGIIQSVKLLGSFDFVFIDGAHEDEYVEADWQNYHDCAPVIGFHDIYGYHDDALIPPNFGPPRLWRRLRGEFKTDEIQSPPACGIGLVFRDA